MQHNLNFADGPAGLAEVAAHKPDFKWEAGLSAAEDDLVMVQGRYTRRGLGRCRWWRWMCL